MEAAAGARNPYFPAFEVWGVQEKKPLEKAAEETVLFENSQISENKQVKRTPREVEVMGDYHHSSRGCTGRIWEGEKVGGCVRLADVHVSDNG